MPNSENNIDDLNFTGKVVSFSTGAENIAIKNIIFEIQRNRLFVVGEIPNGSTKNDWAANRPCAVAWDLVTDYMVFDSEKQYVALLAKSDE